MIQPDATGRGRRACDGILCVGCNVDGSSNGWDTDVSICICDKTLLGGGGICGNGVDRATCGCEEHGSFCHRLDRMVEGWKDSVCGWRCCDVDGGAIQNKHLHLKMHNIYSNGNERKYPKYIHWLSNNNKKM